MKPSPTYCWDCGVELPYGGTTCPDCRELNARLNTKELAKRASDAARREIVARVCAALSTQQEPSQ